MAVLELRVDVDAPVEATWAAATDWERQHEWMLGTRVRQVDAAHLEAYTGRRPLGFLDTMTITAWEPPHRASVLHTGKVVRGTGDFLVEPRGEHSTFVWREDVPLPKAVLLLTWPFLWWSLRRFRTWATAR